MNAMRKNIDTSAFSQRWELLGEERESDVLSTSH